MPEPKIKSLYYITHVNNLSSIFQHGILAHEQVVERGLSPTPIYNADIVVRRQHRLAPNGQSLWQYANLYFQPRNPMLYKVLSEINKNNVVILGIKPRVLDIKGTFIALGNAAHSVTEIRDAKTGLQIIHRDYWSILNNDWWKTEDGTKRKIMAECLVPKVVPPTEIHSIYVASQEMAERLRQQFSSVEVIVEPHMFFQPRRRAAITSHLSWVDGDMFFSQMQTLTISVNTVGVMGKGLASRAKYQFPDMYVVYQDVCKKKQLTMGKPYLYKREASLDSDLADEPLSLPNLNANKWFLLFPTKTHWKQSSDITGIERGLQWLVDSYQAEGIQSLAVPALGCGLGGLDWREIGPLMCRYLSQIQIQVAIYLPQEQEVPAEFLTRDFLLAA
ncbi:MULTISPECIES: DarT ssDNA thymidine ADP-ribosyltransferase family protein [unclassified Thermosynechococcus]|uniref:DarT ssDNA thymidine ADP-ribosyltransferase family protein n=1 Tax=unclassified Thermosynechococcus TaxID=2622553 RepID=UPI002672F553|nr:MULTISPECIES: DarT ssDNA thymidine ADP-ribosyltransferase family protein [unclassified Thermosynechococcus]WKT81551.1 DarT ssDNA thymidine ADP-ribosyltransferase family protein [Thermosynechococcus sp. PP45]WNC32847.1 DarT ssDNA thymidine ADP-ribosyltransferase family protein [Thermosynechococcus sp. PKX95]WNC35373.1 DarT ssDNA thymidine ADP-ribosyltransferase family protein [Thermosynechococcus sp. PKX91]WNC37893.1 DarT ssDNA thymidine ADP-ribosyltransferase family protein [Thermosynechococ